MIWDGVIELLLFFLIGFWEVVLRGGEMGWDGMGYLRLYVNVRYLETFCRLFIKDLVIDLQLGGTVTILF